MLSGSRLHHVSNIYTEKNGIYFADKGKLTAWWVWMNEVQSKKEGWGWGKRQTNKQINNPEHTIQEAKDTEIAGPLK